METLDVPKVLLQLLRSAQTDNFVQQSLDFTIALHIHLWLCVRSTLMASVIDACVNQIAQVRGSRS